MLNVYEPFFVYGNVPHLTLVLSLGDSPRYENVGAYRQRDLNAPDPEDGMTDEQKTRYCALKNWRNETAKLEGEPVTEVAFLGLRIWPNCWRLTRARFLRTRRTFARRVKQFEVGILNEKCFAQCAASSEDASRWFGFKRNLKDLISEEGSYSGASRMKHGGSWNNNANNNTSSNWYNNPLLNENNNSFCLASTVSEQTEFHFDTLVLCMSRDEHAQPRSASGASDRRAECFEGGTMR
jgi:hypothetical protein